MEQGMTDILTAINDNRYGLILILTSFVGVLILLKYNLIKINTDHVQIGHDVRQSEREIIQRQTTFVHGQVDAISNIINREHPGFDRYRTYWICKCVELELVRAIHYNNITNSEGYKDDRYEALLAIVRKKAEDEYFFTAEFETFLREFCNRIVEKLVEIRRLEEHDR